MVNVARIALWMPKFEKKYIYFACSLHADSTPLTGTTTQAAAVCGPSQPKCPEDPRAAATDGVHSAIAPPHPRAAQASATPERRSRAACHHLPLHHQPPHAPAHRLINVFFHIDESGQSAACAAHSYQPTNTSHGTTCKLPNNLVI